MISKVQSPIEGLGEQIEKYSREQNNKKKVKQIENRRKKTRI